MNDNGYIGTATAAVNAVAAVDPCARENAGRVCEAQRILGFVPDGKWGDDTSIAARAFNPSAPPACSPRPSWWAPHGRSNCNTLLVEAANDMATLAAWKRAREGTGVMGEAIRLNGVRIPGLGLGQDPSAAPPPAPPVSTLTPEQAGAQAAGAAADASGKAAMAHHHKLSTMAKVGIGVGSAAVVAGVVYACTRGKKKSRRRSRR